MFWPIVSLCGIILLVVVLKKLISLTSRLEDMERSIYVLQRRLQDLQQTPAREAAERTAKQEASKPALSTPPVIAPAPVADPIPISKPAPSTLETLLQEQRTARPAAEPPPLPAPADSVSTPPSRPTPSRVLAKPLDWEKFLGVKLFAWVGGFALFLGIAFFIKFSFERNLIPPALRVALGFATGLGLVIGGVLLKKRAYLVMSQTLVATGVVVLYAASFAAHGLYNLLGSAPVFALMTLVTAGAFVLAGRLDARVVGVLGMLGGFLTPPLLSSGQDNTPGLFGYIALLNIGLIALALTRRWHFLVALGAIGTVIMQMGWFAKFFDPTRVPAVFAIFSLFTVLYFVNVWFENRRDTRSKEAEGALLLQTAIVFGVAAYFISIPSLLAKPWIIFGIILIADIAVLALIYLRTELFPIHQFAGGCTFLLLFWTRFEFINAHPYWAFTAVIGFAALHSAYPLLLRKLKGLQGSILSASVFPGASLLLMFVVLFQLNTTTFSIWPVVFLLNGLLFAMAWLTRSIIPGIGGALITAFLTSVWIIRLPNGFSGWETLLIIAFFAALFSAGTLFLSRRFSEGREAPNLLERFIPALPAILPFFLLAMMILRPGTASLVGIFGVALFLNLMLLWLSRFIQTPELVLTAFAATLFLEFAWFAIDFAPTNAGLSFAVVTLFLLMFFAYPFFYREALKNHFLPWAISALSAPLHYFLLHHATKTALPEFGAMGLLPAVLALPALVALNAVRAFNVPEEDRVRLMAWFGGSALFFITLIFPIQFDRQWITLGWALEGAALCWLYHRVPHRGLPVAGISLLVIAFIRLGLNPGIFSYYPRSQVPILNWYLYSYGIVAICLLAGAKLLAPPRNIVLGKNAPPILYALGTILLFMLLNIEIADYFGEGQYLRFDFSGSFARDMTYSLAWALFALVLLLIGIAREIAPVRYASIALIGVTLLKLFFHDLSQLNQLYRIGAFIGVAVVLMVASWLYQRYLATQNKPGEPAA